MSNGDLPLQERAILFVSRLGNRVWLALGIAVVVVLLLSLVRVIGFFLVLAIQLALLGLIVYIAVRLALRHHGRSDRA